MTMTSPSTRTAARGTLLAILFRAISFIANQWTLRRLNPVTLGQTAIQLEIGMALAIFTAREGFRLALTSTPTYPPGVAWWTVLAGWVAAALYAMYHGLVRCTHHDTSDDFCVAGFWYSLAIGLEVTAEPVVIYQLSRLRVAPKAAAESFAGLVKTVALVTSLSWTEPVTAFGVAQCAYALTYLLILCGTVIRCDDFFVFTNMWHTPTLRSVGILTTTGLLKFLISEADRLILSSVADSYDQGVYAMASAYGSLAARLLLQPTEETCRLLLSRSDPRTVYAVAVKAVLYIGGVFACLAVNYTAVLMRWTGWDQHKGAVTVLSAYCVYTAVLAANGTTEAYLYTRAGSTVRLTISHACSALVVLALAVPAVSRYGTAGLVWANCVAMVGRVVGNVQYAVQQFGWSIVYEILPRPVVCFLFALCYYITQWSLEHFYYANNEDSLIKSSLIHICVGATCGVGILMLAYSVESKWQQQALRLWSHQKEA